MEKPGEDASPGEIMRWMEESHTQAVIEGLESTQDDEEDSESST